MAIPDKFYAGGFLFDPEKNKILLHQRDGNTKFNPHKWAFFGGLNEQGESPLQCFAREIEEELAVKLKAEQIKPITNYLNIELDTYRYVFYALSSLPISKMRLGEGAGFDWISIDRLSEYDLTEKTIEDLQFFLKTLP